MPVEVTYKEGDVYTWATADFAWTDPGIADREVQALAKSLFTANVTEALGFAESRGLSPRKDFSESFAVFDVARKRPTLKIDRSLLIREISALDARKAVAETLSIAELRSSQVELAKGEVFGVGEKRRSTIGKRRFETFSVVDEFSRTGAFSLKFDESVAITDQGARNLSKSVADAIRVAEALTKRILIDSKRTLQFSESYVDYIGYILNFIESIRVGEGVAKNARLPKKDGFSIKDRGTRNLSKIVLRDIKVDEQFKRAVNYSLDLVQRIYVSDADKRTVRMNKREYFATREAIVRSTRKNVNRNISFVEKAGRVMAFNLYLNDGISVRDAARRTVRMSLKEAVAVFDGVRRAGDMVVSDMILSTEILDDAAFANLVAYGNVPGYERWRDFIPGDYEYREAMFRTVIESKNSDRGMLAGMQVTVDVPDLIDRGSTTVTTAAAGGTVKFQRVFHIVPEITMAIRGGVGTPSVPKITSVSKKGFTFVLEDARTGTLTTGVATWAAHGY